MIFHWGFRPFPFPYCSPPVVPLQIELVNGSTVKIAWPIGVPPALQVRDGTGDWQPLTNGVFVSDHWEFNIAPTGDARMFRMDRIRRARVVADRPFQPDFEGLRDQAMAQRAAPR